jgi:hypothetical protein
MKTILTFFISSICISFYSQSFNWAKQQGTAIIGGTGDVGNSITTDGVNLYTLSDLQSNGTTADVDPNSSIYNVTTRGGTDILLTRLDQSGNLVWAKSFGGTGDDKGKAIVMDKNNGSIYITGSFRNDAFFGSYHLYATCASCDSKYIAKISAGTGNVIWAKSFIGSTPNNSCGYSICLDSIGNVYSTGQFYGTLDFDPNIGVNNLVDIGGSGNIYILKLNSNGDFKWAQPCNNSITAIGTGITTDGKNIYTTGYFQGNIKFGSTPSSSITSAGGDDVLISNIDTAGNFIWLNRFGGSSNDEGFSIIADKNGNTYITGSFFSNNCDFDPSPSTFTLSSAGNFDIFIAKLNNLGNLKWANKNGQNNSDVGLSITTDNQKNIFVSGSNNSIGIILKIDSLGNNIWTRKIGAIINSTVIRDYLNSICSTGSFSGSKDFNPGTGFYNMIASGTRDIFTVKLDTCSSILQSTAYKNDSLCYGKTYLFGTDTLAIAGTYTRTTENYIGCDSLINLILKIIPSPTVSANSTSTIVCSGNQITLTGSGANTYTWSAGITNGTAFTPTVTKTYTVVGSFTNGCSNTSQITVSVSPCTNIQNNYEEKQILITPNPFTDELILKLENYSDSDYDVAITDILGKTIKKEKINGTELVLKLDNLSSGIYYLNIYNHEKIIGNKKIIKH